MPRPAGSDRWVGTNCRFFGANRRPLGINRTTRWPAPCPGGNAASDAGALHSAPHKSAGVTSAMLRRTRSAAARRSGGKLCATATQRIPAAFAA